MANDSNVKWVHLIGFSLTLFAIMVTLSTWAVGQVSALEERAIQRDKSIEACIYYHIIPMREDISAIKMHMGIK